VCDIGDAVGGGHQVNVQREIFKVAEYGVNRIMDREPNAFHASPEVNSAFLACHEQDYAEPEERELDDETAASASAAPTSTERSSSSATTSGAGDGCSRESDVYSFGIILLQLLFGLRIADVERQRNKGKLNESAFRSKHVDVPYAPPPELQDVKLIDEGTTRGKQELLSLALECLHIDPAQRPPLENVCNRLRFGGRVLWCRVLLRVVSCVSCVCAYDGFIVCVCVCVLRPRRNGIVRTLLVDDNVRSIWMDALHIEQKRMNSRKSIILHKAENENRIISSAINQTLGLNIPNLGVRSIHSIHSLCMCIRIFSIHTLTTIHAVQKLKRPNAQIEPAAPVDTNLLPFQMDWQSLYEVRVREYRVHRDTHTHTARAHTQTHTGADVGPYVCVPAGFLHHPPAAARGQGRRVAVQGEGHPEQGQAQPPPAHPRPAPHTRTHRYARKSSSSSQWWWSVLGFGPAQALTYISAASQVGSSRSAPYDFARAKEQNAKHAQVWVRRPYCYFLIIKLL
jgi:serine/threonine protein kinase